MLNSSQEAVLAAVVDTVAPDDADRAVATPLVASALGALPPRKASRLRGVLSLLATPLAGLALAARPCRFDRLDRAARERALLRLGAIRALRPAFDALTRLTLFAAYGAAGDAGESAVWRRLGYPGPRDDVPAAAAPFPLGTVPAGGRIVADAVVVGSGAGGGVTAALLAAAGLRVVVLEAGPAFEPVARRQREWEAFAELYLEAGLAASDDLGVSILAGACVGGGTAVNWSTSLRLPPELAAGWAATLGRPDFAVELTRAYEAVEARLGVTVAASHNRNNAVIADGCARLGWAVRPIPRNAECSGDRCGYCCFGCAYGQKRSSAATYLRDAMASGAIVYADARVDRVRIDASAGGTRAARGVDAIVEDSSSRSAGSGALYVDAPLVIVAAGSLRTPGILARSGVTSPHLGRHLRLHPTTALSARFETPVESWHGVMQSALCDRFPDTVIEAAPSHPGLMASAFPWSGRDAHAATMSTARYRATLIALTRDSGEGTVGLDAHPSVHYTIAPADARRLAEGLAGAARIAFAAGASEVSTLHAQPLHLSAAEVTPAGLDAFADAVRARAAARAPLALFSAHQMGTVRMGASAADGVIDPEGRVYGVEGLLVTDASTFPSASGVNPMLTIMALAHRATTALIARRVASMPSAAPARSRS